MTAVDISFACVIVFLAVCIMAGVGVIVAALCRPIATADAYGMCAPTRRANITASQPQTQRERLAVLLGRIDADYTAALPLPAVATTQQPRRQPAGDYAVPRPADVDAIRANSRTYRLDELAAPEELPIAVDDWPLPQTVQAEPVPAVVNRTAARFAALEFD